MGNFLNPIYLLAVLVALSVHECCHALAAYRLGDPTARDDGRLTLNPVSHLDPIGTLLFFFAGFGWAKPVPVNPTYFRHPKRDTAITALAGPASNLVLAFVSFALLAAFGSRASGVEGLLSGSGGQIGFTLLLQFLRASLFVNTGLFAFNLLPVAPLDGSKILQMFIPWRYDHLYDEWLRIGPIVLIILLVGGQFLPFDPLSTWVFGIAEWTMRLFSLLTAWL